MILATAFVATACISQAQIAQAVGSYITSDTGVTTSSYITFFPLSSAPSAKWLNIRCGFVGKLTPLTMSIPVLGQSGYHDYGGYVRCKYIGPGTPPGGNIGAKFAVWSMRNGGTEVRVTKVSPGARWLYVAAQLTDYYLTSMAYSSTASSPGWDADGGGDFPPAGIHGEALPSVGNNGYWTRHGDYATAAPFVLFPDGFWYADFQMVGTTLFDVIFDGATAGTWDSTILDWATGIYNSRIAYQLVEVNTQPVL